MIRISWIPIRQYWVVAAASLLLMIGSAIPAAAATLPVLPIDVDKVIARVSPVHAGLMTEEINHSLDGGLYAELIRDRALNEEIQPSADVLGPWALIGAVRDGSALALDVSNPLSDAIPASIRIDAPAASAAHRVGVSNSGFWGIPVHANTRYRVSFYAKSGGDFNGPLTASLEQANGSLSFAHADVVLTPGPWKRYEVSWVTPSTTPTVGDARLAITTKHPGTFWLTLVSLFPPTWNERLNGNRSDLMQKLEDLQPKFLRFPAGFYLLGKTVSQRFDWKKTVGPLKDRPGHPSPWNYGSSDGLGYLEFLEWCEDLRIEPVLGVYAGYSADGEIPAGTALQPFVQDALDEIEYAIGDARARWGARRLEDGHPKPFKLTYVEISNEDAGANYDARFAQFYDAIKARYPAIQIIANSTNKNSWVPEPSSHVTSRVPDVLDEHYYMKPSDFFADVTHYDNYDRKGPKIFVGEWASNDLEAIQHLPTGNLRDALGDAVWMIGMERNADIVIMQAYAPLLTNINRDAWQANTSLIGYDALDSYGSPSYYVQLMFNTHRGDEILSVPMSVTSNFFTSATLNSKTGTIYVKAVNASGTPRAVKIEISGMVTMERKGKMLILAGELEGANSIEQPRKIVPVESSINVADHFDYVFPPHSVAVLELHSSRVQ